MSQLTLPLSVGDRFQILAGTWRVTGVPQNDERAVMEDRCLWHPHDVIARNERNGEKGVFTHEFLADIAEAVTEPAPR